MKQIVSNSPVVQNAIIAANKWHGDPYKCPRCSRQGFDGYRCTHCGFVLSEAKRIERAKRTESDAIRKGLHGPIKSIVTRPDIGTIDVPIGKKGVGKSMEHGKGWAKQRQKHANEPLMGEVLVRGRKYRTRPWNDPTKEFQKDIAIIHKDKLGIVSPHGKRFKLDTFHTDGSKARKIEKASR